MKSCTATQTNSKNEIIEIFNIACTSKDSNTLGLKVPELETNKS